MTYGTSSQPPSLRGSRSNSVNHKSNVEGSAIPAKPLQVSLPTEEEWNTLRRQFLESLPDSKSFKELQNEPKKLEDKKKTLLNQLFHVSTQEYVHFLSTQKLITKTYEHLSHIENDLKNIQGDILPTLQDKASSFISQEAPKLQKDQLQNKITLEQHNQIMQLLELPQLADMCILNELYSEALDLEEYIRTLAKNNPDIPLLQQLSQETQQIVLSNVMKRLLKHLRSHMTVPTCLKIVGHLRRLNILSEREIRTAFLQYRCIHIQNVLLSISNRNVSTYQYCTQVTDTLKSQLFEMIMQYQAVFPSSTSTSNFNGGTSSNSFESKGNILKTDFILSACITHLLDPYIKLIEEEINKICNGEEVEKLLEQCMYCGQMLNRVGIDFRGIMVPIFLNRVQFLFEEAIKEAISFFKSEIEQFKWHESYKFITDSKNEKNQASPSVEGEEYIPPRQLLTFIPLAQLTNDILHALNELRKCAPRNLKHSLELFIQEELKNLHSFVQQINVEKHKQPNSSGTPSSEICKQNHKEILKCIQQFMIPHITRCFDSIFARSH